MIARNPCHTTVSRHTLGTKIGSRQEKPNGDCESGGKRVLPSSGADSSSWDGPLCRCLFSGSYQLVGSVTSVSSEAGLSRNLSCRSGGIGRCEETGSEQLVGLSWRRSVADSAGNSR